MRWRAGEEPQLKATCWQREYNQTFCGVLPLRRHEIESKWLPALEKVGVGINTRNTDRKGRTPTYRWTTQLQPQLASPRTVCYSFYTKGVSFFNDPPSVFLPQSCFLFQQRRPGWSIYRSFHTAGVTGESRRLEAAQTGKPAPSETQEMFWLVDAVQEVMWGFHTGRRSVDDWLI